MHALILGGTQFIGKHIAETLLAKGHSVSVLNRGKTPDELPAQVERLRGERDEGAAGLRALKARSWDVCIDVSGYTAIQVRASAELLRNSVARYIFISAVSVYRDEPPRPVTETHRRVPPCSEDITELNSETYGRLKVTCENLIEQIYENRCALLRPQIVAGPGDPSGRYTYWVQRAQQAGPMLALGDGTDHLQVIDVRDLARFAVRVVESQAHGAFNLAGPRLTWKQFMAMLGAQEVVWVNQTVLESCDVTEFELPLFRPERGPRSALMDISNERAKSAGLTLTDPEVTLRDTRSWLQGREFSPSLSLERERELLRAGVAH